MRWYWWLLLWGGGGLAAFFYFRSRTAADKMGETDLSKMVWHTAGSGGSGPEGGGYASGGQENLSIVLPASQPSATVQAAAQTPSRAPQPVVVNAPMTELRAASNPVIVSAELRSPTRAASLAAAPTITRTRR